MKIVEAIQKDEEIKTLKREYKEKYHKNASPYNYDQFKGLDDYKAYGEISMIDLYLKIKIGCFVISVIFYVVCIIYTVWKNRH